MEKYYIYDWAYNQLSKHGSFSTFEDGWDYICEHFPDEEDHQDLFVCTRKEMRQSWHKY